MSIAENISKIRKDIGDQVTLVAVSKYASDEEIQEAYDAGHRDFGENKVQDLMRKYEHFPKDIRWHFIGHLQRNKVKSLLPMAHLLHGVDSLRLMKEIDKHAAQNQTITRCLLQVHIAQEETKFGFDRDEVKEILSGGEIDEMKNVLICGLMGMATNTPNSKVVESEFLGLVSLYEQLKAAPLPNNVQLNTLSFGMSQDYPIAVKAGSNLVRIGSAVFEEN